MDRKKIKPSKTRKEKPTDEKRERKLKEESKKVSRRVPTAVPLFFVNDVYSETKKEHGKPKLGNN